MIEPNERPQPAEPQSAEPQPQVPRRELRDPRALRAMAHPVRLRIMDELTQLGQATATELAERIGESAANCSWHLRQLARYGYIKEAGGGTGRQRPWKVVVQSTYFGGSGKDDAEVTSAADAAADAFAEVLLDRELERYRAWRTSRHQTSPAWREASFLSRSIDWLTADELASFRQDFDSLIERHFRHGEERASPAQRPPGARLVHLVTWAVPGSANVVSDPDIHPSSPPPHGDQGSS